MMSALVGTYAVLGVGPNWVVLSRKKVAGVASRALKAEL
jgi:hypothetical protein